MRLGSILSVWVFAIATTTSIVSSRLVHAQSRQQPTPQSLRATPSAIQTPPLSAPDSSTVTSGSQPPIVTERADVFWSNPAQLLFIPDALSPTAPQTLDGALPVVLTPRAVLLVPVSPGDWVEVTTADPRQPLQLGFADGNDSRVDWLLWQRNPLTSVQVPSFTTANFVAIRSQRSTTVRVKQSTTLEEPLDWFEMDRRVANWLFTKGPKPLSSQDHGRTLRSAAQMRDLLTELDALQISLSTETSEGLRHLLFAVWLEESLRVRPIVGPFFESVGSHDGAQPRVLTAPMGFTFRDPGELHRLRLRGFGDTTLAVFEGKRLSRMVHFYESAESPSRWSNERRLRTVAGSYTCVKNSPEIEPYPSKSDSYPSKSDSYPSKSDSYPSKMNAHAFASEATSISRCNRELRLQVLKGSISLSVDAYVARNDYRTVFGQISRSLREHWAVAALDSSPWISGLARAKLGQSLALPFAPSAKAPLSRLTNIKKDAPIHGFLAYQASLLAEDLPRAVSYAFSALRSSRSNYLRVAAATRLVDLGVPEKQLDRKPLLNDIVNTESDGEHLELFDGNSLEALLFPLRTGLRPQAGERLENWAKSAGGSSDARRVTTAYWKAFEYRYVAPELGAITFQRQRPVTETGQCTQTDDDTTRWLVPNQMPVSFEVTLPDGLYALSSVIPLSETPTPEGYVTIDDVPISVHSGAGLPSRVALANGTHLLSLERLGPAVAMELTAGMTAPCGSLRLKQTWTKLVSAQPTRFLLAAPGAATVVRLRFESPAPNSQITIDLRSRQLFLEQRTAGAYSTEFLVGPNDDSLTLTSRNEAIVQVSMRRQADPKPEPARLLATPKHLPTNATATSQALSDGVKTRAVQSELPSLRKLSAALHAATTNDERRRNSEQRATLLLKLGYRQLGLRDIAAFPTADDNTDFAYFLGSDSKTIPLGLLSQLPPLPLPRSLEHLISRKTQRNRSGDTGCSSPANDDLVARGDAESLLTAYCAERSNQPSLAARLYETIANNTGYGSAYLRAATLHADSAIDSSNLGPTLRSAIVATLGARHGADPSDLWARLGRAISWTTASVLDGAAGYVTLVKTGNRERTTRELVTTALSLAKQTSLLIEPNERAELTIDNQRVQKFTIEHGCDDERGESCQFVTLIDGISTPCSTTMATNRCVLTVPIGRHRIELSFVGNTPFGWVNIETGTTPLLPQVRSLWHQLEPNRAATLTLKGPTILRLRFRVRGASFSPSIANTVRLSGCGSTTDQVRLELSTVNDSGVKSWPENGGSSVSTEQLVDVPVQSDSRCQLSILSQKPGTLVQVSLARAVGLPNARLDSKPILSQVNPAELTQSHALDTITVPRPPREQTGGLPLLLGLRTRLMSESLTAITEQDGTGSEKSFQDVFAETSVIAARELVENRLWGTAQAGTRFRIGPTTKFGRLSVELPPQPGLPGIELQANTYSQSFSETNYTSFNSTARINTLFAISANQSIVPQLSYTSIRSPQKPLTDAPVDGDVHSNYVATHPRYGSADLAFKLRPFIDAMSTLAVSARSLPALNGFDRVSGTADLWFLPNNDWPLMITTGWFSSYRPESDLRARYFVRHQLNFGVALWKWLTEHERVRIYAQFDCFFDAPATSSTTLIFAPTLTIDFTTSGNRGLRDQSSQQVPFRAFQERGSARIHPNATGLIQSLPTESVP